MIRLSIIISIIHFALAYGLRHGFRRTSELNSEFAAHCADFASKIEFVLTQPGRSLCELFGWAEGSVGFWVLMVATSILWGNVFALLIKRVFASLFR